MAPVTLPVMICGLLTCLLLEKPNGSATVNRCRQSYVRCYRSSTIAAVNSAAVRDRLRLIAQGIIGIWLVTALAMHLAEVGLIGLSVIILATTFSGVTDEHAIGKAFTEARRSPPC